MIKHLPKLTFDLEPSICGELLPSPSSDIKLRPEVEDNVALEVAAWSWERDEKGRVGEGNLITFSPSVDVPAPLSLKELEASWRGSGFCTEVLTELY